jgi:hypothetical protein
MSKMTSASIDPLTANAAQVFLERIAGQVNTATLACLPTMWICKVFAHGTKAVFFFRDHLLWIVNVKRLFEFANSSSLFCPHQ